MAYCDDLRGEGNSEEAVQEVLNSYLSQPDPPGYVYQEEATQNQEEATQNQDQIRSQIENQVQDQIQEQPENGTSTTAQVFAFTIDILYCIAKHSYWCLI